MENNYCVYKHTTPSGKVYIGLTSRPPKERWKGGYGYKKSNPHFWSAIQKYGWDNIKHEILLSGLSKQQASEFEKMYICLYNSADRRYGYNKTYGGENGAKPTEETISKISGSNHYLAKKIEQYSLDGEYLKTFDCVINAAKTLNVDCGSIASCARHNHYRSHNFIWVYEDEPQKEYWIKRGMSDYIHGGNSPKAKKVIQYDLNGNYIKTYSCATEAAKTTKTPISRISDCANGKRYSSNGFIWLYEDDDDIKTKLMLKIQEKRHPSAMCGGSNHRAKAIEQYTLYGDYIKTYSSASEAAEKLGIDYSSIKQCAGNKKKQCKSAGGFIWINSDEPDKQSALKQRMKIHRHS